MAGIADYSGGWVDTALTTFAVNTFLALPGILLAIAFAEFPGPGFTNLVLALAIGGCGGYTRLSARRSWPCAIANTSTPPALWAPAALRIVIRRILRNIVQALLVQAAIGMAGVILH